MSIKIKYAYLKDQTWLYRRNYPKDVALVLGKPALKRSLKTGDPKTAAGRAADRVVARIETAHVAKPQMHCRPGIEIVGRAEFKPRSLVLRYFKLRDHHDIGRDFGPKRLDVIDTG